MSTTTTGDEIRAALERQGNDCDYDTWIKLGHAIKAALPGKDGLAIWLWWSSLSSKERPRSHRKEVGHVQARSCHRRHNLLGVPAMMFIPTHEWQDLPDDATLPPGCQIEVDVSTGTKRARIAPNGNGHDFEAAFPEEWAKGDPKPEPGDAQLAAITPIDWANVSDDEPPPRRFLIEHWMPAGCLSSLYGPGGVGKSLLAQQAATCLVAGIDFLGHKVEQTAGPGPVQ